MCRQGGHGLCSSPPAVHFSQVLSSCSQAAGRSNALEQRQSHVIEECWEGLEHLLRTAVCHMCCMCRARLEEMDVRLQRNLEAVDAAHANAEQAPRTVERVLRSVAAGGKGRRAAAATAVTGSQDD